jgi:SAM-dependent methyltransferase
MGEEISRLERFSYAMQRWITPGLAYSQASFEQRLKTLVPTASSWLDLGCGHRLLPEWRGAAETELVKTARFAVGVDTDLAAIRRHRSFTCLCLGDIARLPFQSESFDLVTANMVVEHLGDPAVQFAEVARVLAPGGRFVFHTPNARSYIVAITRLLPDGVKRFLARVLEDRVAEDVYPTHYRANEKEAIERISAQSGFEIERIDFVNTSPALGMAGPLLIPELLWIRQLQRRSTLEQYRAVLICALRKQTKGARPA